MLATRRRDTACELAVRSAAHRLGLRFRVDWPLPGTRRRADLAFTRSRVAVFVDGCFWHGCPQHATWPKRHAAWWKDKIERNMSRDRDTDERLRAIGWLSLRFWEHEDSEKVASQLMRALTASGRGKNGVRGVTERANHP